MASRTRLTSPAAAAPTLSRAPVVPISDAAYTNPRQSAVIRAIRASGELGATRKTRSRPQASEASSQSPASSGGRSGVISPAPPAAARSRAKAATP